MTQPEDQLRILRMIERGELSAEEGARLIAAVTQPRDPPRRAQPARQLRVRVTNVSSSRQILNVTVPTSLISIGVKLGARLLPGTSEYTIGDIQRMIENGAAGRIYEMLDLEAGERIEIFVE